jgi:hypothetical protein
MSRGSSCALDAANQTLVCGDGPELLVYNGADGKPTWKEFCEDILVAVGVGGGQVISVDASGRVVRWQNGRRLGEQMVGTTVHLAAVSASGAVALASQTHIFLPRGGEHFSLPFEGATGLSFDSAAAFVAVVSASGQVVVINVADGRTVGAISIPGGASGVAWNPSGCWCVATSGGVQVLSSDGATVVNTISTAVGPVTGVAKYVACSADGALMAITIDHCIQVYDALQYVSLGTIEYKRELSGIGFGGGTVLYVGLDDGEANTIDLARGSSCRTEPHAGRGRTNWNFKASLDNAQVRGVIARAKTAGGPVASFVYRKPDEGKKRSGCKTTCMVVLVLSVLCGGCSGVSSLLYHLLG